MPFTRYRGLEIQSLDEHASSSRFGRLDARAKLVGVIAFVIASAMLTEIELVLASLVIAVALAAASAVPPRHVAKLYLGALPFILIASLSLFLFAGIESGAAMLGRTSACVLALAVLASATETFELYSGLRRLHVPAVMTTLLMLTHKYISILAEELAAMTIARRARGFLGGRHLLDKYAFKIISYTAGMLLVKSAHRADRAYEGLKSRGFDNDIASWRMSRIAAKEVLFMGCLLGISSALLALQVEVVW